jgi:probable rRNA maturation factor
MSKKTDSCRVEFHAQIGAAFVPYLRRQVRSILQLTRAPLRELSIVLVNDKKIGEIHDEFFGDPTTTDVITFPLELGPRKRAISGELYVCVPMARRQAKEQGVAAQDELLLYVLHGVLHLDGHDDCTAAGYKRMHKTEDEILTKLGIGAIFASASAGKAGR